MSISLRHILFLFSVLLCAVGHSQQNTLRSRYLTHLQAHDTIILDTLTVYSPSIQVTCKGIKQASEAFFFDPLTGKFCSHQDLDSLFLTYRVFSFQLNQPRYMFEQSVITPNNTAKFEQYAIPITPYSNSDFFGDPLTKTGSISRGLTFGNSQDIGVNSTLNMELSGKIAPNLSILASISDDNIPIQPDGNTNKLQEFDQIYIQLFNEHLKLVAGDFWLSRPNGFFMNYKKRAQGLTLENAWQIDSTKKIHTQFSAALSKGKFCRQIIPGVEGNQGPYRLRGAENEPFIIILAGTERVYIDGRLLERGQDRDYTINYNNGEVIFTSKNFITKDIRIVVEFQYADQNYARTLMQSATTLTTKKGRIWFNAYSEQDAKNQSLQQQLSLQQKALLYQIGDTLTEARMTSIDSIGFTENKILYQLKDSLGYDSILVFSIDPLKAVFFAVFTQVGLGNGDYVLDSYNALGKVYKWVAPVNGVSQGDFAPVKLIMPPKQNQMISSGFNLALSKTYSLESELAYTKNDLNTFSPFNARDDHGLSNRTKLTGKSSLGKKNLIMLENTLESEVLNQHFSPIEQYRTVEFDRDWNTRNMGYSGFQLLSGASSKLTHKTNGSVNVDAKYFQIGTEYTGKKLSSNGNWKQGNTRANWTAAYLVSNGINQTQFIRHKATLAKRLNRVEIGYTDDHELNLFRDNNKQLQPLSYQFFDYQFFLASADTTNAFYKIYFRERFDGRPKADALLQAAKAQTIGAEITLKRTKTQALTIYTNYRSLTILDTTLIQQRPENTLLGRVDHELKLWKGALTMNHFYEVGSGLELKKTFVYVKVNDGQGLYTWIDYNADGIKDLNEFEVAQYIDQASYIRIFSPSNEYMSTYSNEFNQSVYWRPEKIWSNAAGIKRILSKFSDQARVRLQRKTTSLQTDQLLNPYASMLRDTNLIASSSNIKNTLFFNRLSSQFNADYTYSETASKTLLASGYDSKSLRYHELSFRANFFQKITVDVKAQQGQKVSFADYTLGRNYSVSYSTLQPTLTFQPTTTFRATVDCRFSTKQNALEYGGEQTLVKEIGSSIKINKTEKSSFQANVKAISIRYEGNTNSPVGYELLESLLPGLNFTWNMGLQRELSKNLQLSIQYIGRKSETGRTIHSGGMELRAFL